MERRFCKGFGSKKMCDLNDFNKFKMCDLDKFNKFYQIKTILTRKQKKVIETLQQEQSIKLLRKLLYKISKNDRIKIVKENPIRNYKKRPNKNC